MANTRGDVSVMTLAERLATEADAYEYLEELRWAGKPFCPHCGNDERCYFLQPKDGSDSRKTRTGSRSQRRVWKCGACRKQFSVLTGTTFHGTKIPLRKWLFVIFEMCASKNGVAAREIERKCDLTAKSAWFMLHRIREAMKREPLAGMLSGGVVVADETVIGGKEKNRHQSKRHNPPGNGERIKPGTKRDRGDKVAVLSLIHEPTGEARSVVVPDVTGATLSEAMSELGVHKESTTLHTDGLRSYRSIAGEFGAHEYVDHEYVDHEAGEYVRDGVTTNPAENFFSQLKRSLDGTHHDVSREHLPRYLGEFDFRFTTTHDNDGQRMARLMGRTYGRRLSYRPLAGQA
jgi:transposase-like protein